MVIFHGYVKNHQMVDIFSVLLRNVPQRSPITVLEIISLDEFDDKLPAAGMTRSRVTIG